jgi:hypothetical protein
MTVFGHGLPLRGVAVLWDTLRGWQWLRGSMAVAVAKWQWLWLLNGLIWSIIERVVLVLCLLVFVL